MDLPQYRGAQHEDGLLALCNLQLGYLVWLECEWKHGGADVLHQRLGANENIQAGEVRVELEPGGGDFDDETAKPTTAGVDDNC